ncbi:MAG: acyl carrier protein [Eubacterium sp.]|nr:acyl carrier protein [Eubacterium sp.]
MMETEEVKESILDILQELHEDVDFENEEQLVDDKILDSFDLVTLVAELGEEFDVEITAKDFVTENFNSVERLTNMVIRLMDE